MTPARPPARRSPTPWAPADTAAQALIGDAALPMGGICHVATLAAERNKGYASALMRDALRAMRAQGLCTSVLFPFSFRYYRKFGYELAGNHCQFVAELAV